MIYDKQPTDEKLRKQIKVSRILFHVFSFGALIITYIGYLKEEFVYLFVMLLLMMLAIGINSQEYYDKIRLEIRELKRRR